MRLFSACSFFEEVAVLSRRIRMCRTGNTFPLAVYSTSLGSPSGPVSWSVPSCSPSSRKARQSSEIRGLKLGGAKSSIRQRSEEHTSELQSLRHLVCRLL